MSRPALDPEGKRHPISFRTTKEVRERIEADAKANGRSISQEIEFRIEAGYEISAAKKAVDKSNSLANALIGDEKTAAMVRAMAAAIGSAMSYSGKHWDCDVYARAAVRGAVEGVIAGTFLSEKMENEDPDKWDADLLRKHDKVGRMFGRFMALSRGDLEQIALVEEFSRSSLNDARPEVADFVTNLIGQIS